VINTLSSNAFATQKGNVNRLLGMKWSILLLEIKKEEFQSNKEKLNNILKNKKIKKLKLCKKIVKKFQKNKIQKNFRNKKSNKEKNKNKFKNI